MFMILPIAYMTMPGSIQDEVEAVVKQAAK